MHAYESLKTENSAMRFEILFHKMIITNGKQKH